MAKVLAPGETVKTSRKAARKKPPMKLTKHEVRTVGQVIAAIAAAFLPIASYVLAHSETARNPWMWPLIAAGLAFSAPTLAEWAERWCKSPIKAWGFTILLEGVMIFASSAWLSLTGLAILVAINAHAAWTAAAKYVTKESNRA